MLNDQSPMTKECSMTNDQVVCEPSCARPLDGEAHSRDVGSLHRTPLPAEAGVPAGTPASAGSRPLTAVTDISRMRPSNGHWSFGFAHSLVMSHWSLVI